MPRENGPVGSPADSAASTGQSPSRPEGSPGRGCPGLSGSPTAQRAAQPTGTRPSAPPKFGRGTFVTARVAAWASWDVGASSFDAVVVTFVFSVYLTRPEIFGPSANANLGWATALAGIAVALIAPAVGQWTDRTGRSRTVLAVSTAGVVAVMAALFFVEPDEGYLLLGLVLLSLGNVVFEIGSVVYNSMVAEVASPSTVGRVSGFGWGVGYLGSIVLLAVLLVGFINPDPGLLGVTHEGSAHIRVSMVACAVWMLAFALPLLLLSRNRQPTAGASPGFFGAYRDLARSVERLWATDRPLVRFLVASAIYRDGLAGIFTFGGILAGVAFGFSESEVMVFAVAANLVAGIATVAFGQLDDRLGAPKVIVGSLAAMCALGLAVFLGKPLGPAAFWVFGLALCVFVGPAQAASRSYLARITPSGREGELFGLYATSGRAASFLAPFMYSTAITLAHAVSGRPKDDVAVYGILGIVAVLALGLIAFVAARVEGGEAEGGGSTAEADQPRAASDGRDSMPEKASPTAVNAADRSDSSMWAGP